MAQVQTPREIAADKTVTDLMPSHQGRLRAYLAGCGVPSADLDDATNVSFFNLWKALRRGQIENPTAFLYAIARNLRISLYRASEAEIRRGIVYSLDDPQAVLLKSLLGTEQFEVRRSVELHELHEALEEAISKLPERTHTIFSRCVLDEEPHKNVAEALKTTEDAISVQVSRTKTKLLKQLKRKFGVSR